MFVETKASRESSVILFLDEEKIGEDDNVGEKERRKQTDFGVRNERRKKR